MMRLSKGNKFLFIGDSITDCGRKKPEGEGAEDGLGHGYVSFTDALLQTVYPELGVRVVNKGIDGNTVRNLKERWQEDVLDQHPDWLSMMIGINDVWRQYDRPLIKEKHVYYEEYEKTLEKLVKETRPHVEGLVLMTPFYIEDNQQDQMRSTMDLYGTAVKRIAAENDCVFVDTQAAFDKVLNYTYSSAIARDRVHPSATGHMILTRALLNSLEFDWQKS